MELQSLEATRSAVSLHTCQQPHPISVEKENTSSESLEIGTSESAVESVNTGAGAASHFKQSTQASWPGPCSEQLGSESSFSSPAVALSISCRRKQAQSSKHHAGDSSTVIEITSAPDSLPLGCSPAKGDSKQHESAAIGTTRAESLPQPFPSSRLSSSDPKGPPLVSYDELPDWYKDNELIREKYRPVSNSYGSCIASWKYMHNETVNIFSHAIPAVVFLAGEGLVVGYLQKKYPHAAFINTAMFVFFLLTATICLALSATYHTLMNHSDRISNFCLRLDFVGIVILTLGCFVSGIQMVFYCEPKLRWIYWGIIASLACITIVIMIHPKFQGRRWRTFRVIIFISTGLSGFVPLTHGITIFGFKQMLLQLGSVYYLAEGALFVLGAIFYTTRIPESLHPGRYDLYGCSHQIFHVLVVLATATHLLGILHAFNYNYHNRICNGN